jgi:hypothetical protein
MVRSNVVDRFAEFGAVLGVLENFGPNIGQPQAAGRTFEQAPERVASEAVSLLSASNESRQKLAAMGQGLAEVTRLLGPPGAVERAADAIVGHLQLAQSNAK